MRTASRVFGAIGVFAIVAAFVYYAGQGFGRDATQAAMILTFFAIANGYLWFLLRHQARADLSAFGASPVGGEAGHAAEIHLPGPSIWPAGYGLAGLLVVLGLTLSRGLLIAGAVVLVVASVGWARESVHGYRGELARGHREPEMVPHALVEAGQRVAEFRDAHRGADAMVQHLGLGWAEIVLVGADGVWGNLVVRDIGHAREACELAGVAVHEHWPQGVGARVRNDEEFWYRMAGGAHGAHVVGPRDGYTQVGAKVFASIGAFGLVAGLIFILAQHRGGHAYQGGLLLGCFALASGYLYVALRNARGGPADFVHVGDRGVAAEPSEPEPFDPAALHLPGPSIWPAAFGVAGLCIMLGLIVSKGLLYAGAALIVLSSVGWAIESVREYRASISGHGAH
ncbi:MAG: hypothetical protein ABR520_06460 [Mycobacteriales bacterium]|nr:cytochrome c oxidase subunit 4 [Frankia sp.]